MFTVLSLLKASSTKTLNICFDGKYNDVKLAEALQLGRALLRGGNMDIRLRKYSGFGQFLLNAVRCEIAPIYMPGKEPDWWEVKFCSGNGLVPSGTSQCWPRSMSPYSEIRLMRYGWTFVIFYCISETLTYITLGIHNARTYSNNITGITHPRFATAYVHMWFNTCGRYLQLKLKTRVPRDFARSCRPYGMMPCGNTKRRRIFGIHRPGALLLTLINLIWALYL